MARDINGSDIYANGGEHRSDKSSGSNSGSGTNGSGKNKKNRNKENDK